MHMIFGEGVPAVPATMIVQFDRPRRASDRVRKAGTGSHIVHRKLLAPDDPARLADARKTVSTYTTFAEAVWKLAAQERDGPIRLVATLERAGRGLERVERRLDMGHVHGRNAASGDDEGEALAPDQPVPVTFLLHPRVDLVAGRLVGFVDVFQNDHLRSEHRAVRRLPAGEASLPDQRGIAARFDKPGRFDVHVAVTCRELDAADPAALDLHPTHHGAKHHGDTGLANRFLDPAGECNLVVIDNCGQRPVPVMQGLLLGAELAQNVVGYAVGELVAMSSIGKQTAKRSR